MPILGFKSMTSINSIAATTKQNINKPNITNYLSSPTNVDELPVTLGRCPDHFSIHCFLRSNGVREAFTMALALASASATTIFFLLLLQLPVLH